MAAGIELMSSILHYNSKGNLSANASYGLYLESKQVHVCKRDGIAMPRRQNSTQCRKVKVHLEFPEILTKRTSHTAGAAW